MSKFVVFIPYIIAINILAFLLYGLDKFLAMKHAYRIPEIILILIAAAGGSIGALCGMYIFRHKTKHRKFTEGIPAILTVQTVLAINILVGTF